MAGAEPALVDYADEQRVGHGKRFGEFHGGGESTDRPASRQLHRCWQNGGSDAGGSGVYLLADTQPVDVAFIGRPGNHQPDADGGRQLPVDSQRCGILDHVHLASERQRQQHSHLQRTVESEHHASQYVFQHRRHHLYDQSERSVGVHLVVLTDEFGGDGGWWRLLDRGHRIDHYLSLVRDGPAELGYFEFEPERNGDSDDHSDSSCECGTAGT